MEKRRFVLWRSAASNIRIVSLNANHVVLMTSVLSVAWWLAYILIAARP
jgi:hypothetical protein